jgi:hypothetical protein
MNTQKDDITIEFEKEKNCRESPQRGNGKGSTSTKNKMETKLRRDPTQMKIFIGKNWIPLSRSTLGKWNK